MLFQIFSAAADEAEGGKFFEGGHPCDQTAPKLGNYFRDGKTKIGECAEAARAPSPSPHTDP